MNVARCAEFSCNPANEREPARAAAMKDVGVIDMCKQREEGGQFGVTDVAAARERFSQCRQRDLEDRREPMKRLPARAGRTMAMFGLRPVRRGAGRGPQ